MKLNKTDKVIKAFEKRLKELIQRGIPPREAVEMAYREFPIMKELKDELTPQLIEEMERGGSKASVSVLQAAALKAWAPDALTLSSRTTKGKRQIIGEVAGIICNAIKEGKAVSDAAEAMFDGYGYGQTLPPQDIPKFLKKLAKIAPDREYKESGYKAALRNAKRHIEKLTTQGMKAAYNDVKRAIEQGNEKKIEKAIYAATQERTRYFAKRIARTELARAYTDGFMAKWAGDDDCVAFQWKLSTGHPVCDICDMYAEADLYGMGQGIFPKDKVPLLPVHPNCMCHLRPVIAGSKLLKRETPIDRIERGGREWLDKQTIHTRQGILGVYGAKEVKAGRSWIEKARGYSGEKMKSRIVLAIPEEFKHPDKLVIPETKLTKYCLDKTHKTGRFKAVAFEKYLGYTQENSRELDELIRKSIPAADIVERKADKYGRTFQAKFFVVDIQGKKILMVTGWKQSARDEYPRLTSAYLKPEKKGGKR